MLGNVCLKARGGGGGGSSLIIQLLILARSQENYPEQKNGNIYNHVKRK